MAIVVLNKTPYATAILEKIILFACKIMGIAGATTFVKITCKKSLGIGGVFTSGKPRLGSLRKKGLSESAKLRILGQIDSGWVHISVPTLSRLQWRSVFIIDAVVQDFFATLLHEFAHARDYKKNPHTYWGPQYQGYTSSRSWRRSRWADRPCEISAVRQTDRALAKLEKNRTKTALLRELGAEFKKKAREFED